MSCSHSLGQQLGVNDLPVVMDELNDIRANWYNIGLQLRVSIGTLNAIKKDYNSTSDCLRETITTWLKTYPSPPTWKNIVDALRSNTVGEVRLAADLEQKYCSTQDTSLAAAHHYAPPAPSQADSQMTSPQWSQSQALTWTTPPPQSTISTIPQDTSPIPPPGSVTTPPDRSPPVTTHTLGMRVIYLCLAYSVTCSI